MRQDASSIGSEAQIVCNGVEGEGSQHLIEPRHIEPQHLEAADVQHGNGNGKQGGCEQETLCEWLLVVVTEVGHNHACCTEGTSARTHRGSHDAKHSQHETGIAQPVVAHLVDQQTGIHLHRSAGCHGVIEFLVGSTSRDIQHIDELHCGGCPDESHHTFRNHSTIEATEPVLLVLDASRHHGALRGMETADCTASYRDEQPGEQRSVFHGIMVCEGICNAGYVAVMRKDANADEDSHDE